MAKYRTPVSHTLPSKSKSVRITNREWDWAEDYLIDSIYEDSKGLVLVIREANSYRVHKCRPRDDADGEPYCLIDGAHIPIYGMRRTIAR